MTNLSGARLSAQRPIIELTDVSFAYDSAPVIAGVNLTIPEGDFASIIGPNGGGKTTLIKLMLGLLEPAEGRVRVFGRRPKAVRRNIGYLPQHPQLDPSFPLTVSDVVLMGRLGTSLLGFPGRRDREIVRNALNEVDLADLLQRPFAALSGGQRQRVLIARALACQPRMLILDEPTANLDPGVQDELHELLHRLNEHLTVVIVSHDVNFVSQYVKTVVCVSGDVAVHCTSDIDAEALRNLYGREMRLVRHDHDHTHDQAPDAAWHEHPHPAPASGEHASSQARKHQ